MSPTTPSEALAGRCAAVTGAGRGFGEQAAFELARLGAAVAVLDIDADAAERCAARLSRAGARALALACDVSDDDAVQRAFEQAGAELAPVDILVNNAGIVSTTPFLELTMGGGVHPGAAIDYQHVELLPCRRSRDGRAALRAHRQHLVRRRQTRRRLSGRSAYATAKAGVIGFTKALARELAPCGITVNAIAPGAMDTEMTRALSDDPALLARVLSVVPFGRRGVIQDVADAVAFLSSDLSSYLTGETLNVDGGVTME